jgi:2'-5' RNA ligase
MVAFALAIRADCLGILVHEGSMTLEPFIVTLELDPDSFEILDALRKEHFPPERNFLSAHITLFHKLPGDEEASIKTTLREVCERSSSLTLSFLMLRFLGKGVAVNVESPELLELRKNLALAWAEWLEPQDKQPFKPHVTIQNKVTSEEARTLFEHLKREWLPINGQGEGLLLWRYLGGPWELVEKFSFLEQ